jgi:hypothetical protein
MNNKKQDDTPILQHSATAALRFRAQPVRRSFRFMLKVGLASEARFTARRRKDEHDE